MATPSVVTAYSGLPVVQQIPTNIRTSGIMSDTSSAGECFINQRFSAKLQAFMISYVNSIASNYAVYSV
jgi:hypothetical protein